MTFVPYVLKCCCLCYDLHFLPKNKASLMRVKVTSVCRPQDKFLEAVINNICWGEASVHSWPLSLEIITQKPYYLSHCLDH